MLARNWISQVSEKVYNLTQYRSLVRPLISHTVFTLTKNEETFLRRHTVPVASRLQFTPKHRSVGNSEETNLILPKFILYYPCHLNYIKQLTQTQFAVLKAPGWFTKKMNNANYVYHINTCTSTTNPWVIYKLYYHFVYFVNQT